MSAFGGKADIQKHAVRMLLRESVDEIFPDGFFSKIFSRVSFFKFFLVFWRASAAQGGSAVERGLINASPTRVWSESAEQG
jgi:hypothetical protein